MERLICLAIGYVCGLFQTSYIYGRLHGIDIRNYGSGNAGTTNALRTLGKKAGALTLLGDALKCVVAVFIVRAIYGQSRPEEVLLLGLYASAGTILGHNFPFYLGFKGGKGIAATAGLLFSFDWRLALAAVAVFLVFFFLTHYVSLGSILIYVVFVGGIILMGQLGFLEVSPDLLPEMYILAAALMVMAVYRHRENIKRLLQGCERKTYLSSKRKEG